jgi:predicted nucleotidyltransferase component of viral defense system
MEKNFRVAEIKEAYKSSEQRELLLKLLENEIIEKSFFLTGGTALSVFYLGHRISEDLDFFTTSDVNLGDLSFWIKLKFSSNANIVSASEFFLSYEIFNMRVDFVIDKLSINCVRNAFEFENKRKLTIDCIENIASNKLCAIVSRLEIRDLIDFYFIMKTFNLDFDEIYKICIKKEALFDDPPSAAFEIEQRLEVLKNLKFIPLNMLKKVNVDDVISFFDKIALRLYRKV